MTHEEILSMLGDYVDYLIANSSAEAPMWNIEKVRSGKPNKWNYIDGCMITACLSLYKTTGDEKYLKFSKDFIDWFVQEDGSIKTYDPKEYNLDNVNQGKNLFILYDIFGDEKYRKAIDTIRSQLLTQPRTKEGSNVVLTLTLDTDRLSEDPLGNGDGYFQFTAGTGCTGVADNGPYFRLQLRITNPLFDD